jgi:hypothetical protein
MKEYTIKQLREYWISSFGLKGSKIITPKIKKQIEEEIRSFLIRRIRESLHLEYPDLSKIKVQDFFLNGDEIGIKEKWKVCLYDHQPVFRFLMNRSSKGLLYRVDFKDY